MARLDHPEDDLVGHPQKRSEIVEIRWQEYRAALIVSTRVPTPEVLAEVERAKRAFQEVFDAAAAPAAIKVCEDETRIPPA